MVPTSFDRSVLFATEHGIVKWAPDGRVRVSLADRHWTLDREQVGRVHDAMQTLARQVYRCECDCRWQFRIEKNDTTVLSTDDVLRLHSLLDGATTMLELCDVLEEAAIDLPEVGTSTPSDV